MYGAEVRRRVVGCSWTGLSLRERFGARLELEIDAREVMVIHCNAGDAPELDGVDPVGALLTRELARHHSELSQTREQLVELLSAPSASLLTALDDELVAAAIAMVEAMSALRRKQVADALEPSSADSAPDAVRPYLARVAGLTRSVLAIHLAMEVQAGSI